MLQFSSFQFSLSLDRTNKIVLFKVVITKYFWNFGIDFSIFKACFGSTVLHDRCKIIYKYDLMILKKNISMA